MKSRHQITVSSAAVRQGKACGLRGDVEARVKGLAAVAMPAKHPAGNSVYGPYVLHIRGTHVLSIILTGPVTVDSRSVGDCSYCHGLMSRKYVTTLEGKEGVAYRPCPRAYDASKPLCDSVSKGIKS